MTSRLSSIALSELGTKRGPRQLVDMEVSRCAGRGNCLFNALGGVAPKPCSGVTMRKRICDFMSEQQTCILDDGESLGDWIRYGTGKEPNTYIKRMRRDGEWGGGLELFAFSLCENTSVKVCVRRFRALRRSR